MRILVNQIKPFKENGMLTNQTNTINKIEFILIKFNYKLEEKFRLLEHDIVS